MWLRTTQRDIGIARRLVVAVLLNDRLSSLAKISALSEINFLIASHAAMRALADLGRSGNSRDYECTCQCWAAYA
jgi:hypothetical protein